VKYDVAISFLSHDEAVARRLLELLKGVIRGDIFFSPEQQRGLVGSDGDLAFTKVFRDESRVVVVLYRLGWGTTTWTHVEESAIRERRLRVASDDFLLLISLDPPAIPEWLPATAIWLDYPRYRAAGAAAVIEQKVGSAGGQVGPELPVERARRLVADRNRQQVRRARQSSEGDEQFRTHIGALRHALISHVNTVRESEPDARLSLEDLPEGLAVNCGWASLVLDWTPQTIRTVGEPLELGVAIRDQPTHSRGIRARRPNELYGATFCLKLLEDDLWLWKRQSKRGALSDTESLANQLLNQLLDFGVGSPRPPRHRVRPT
jgi:hypothetical protein